MVVFDGLSLSLMPVKVRKSLAYLAQLRNDRLSACRNKSVLQKKKKYRNKRVHFSLFWLEKKVMERKHSIQIQGVYITDQKQFRGLFYF